MTNPSTVAGDASGDVAPRPGTHIYFKDVRPSIFYPFMCHSLDSFIDRFWDEPAYINLTKLQVDCLIDEIHRVSPISLEDKIAVPMYRGIPLRVLPWSVSKPLEG